MTRASASTQATTQQRSRQTRRSTQQEPKQRPDERSTPEPRISGESSTQRERKAQGATVRLPFVTAEFHRPDVHVPSGQDVASAAQTVRSQLPSTEQTLFYGALGLGAAFALIEWPVAVAIGVGSALAQRGRGQARTSA